MKKLIFFLVLAFIITSCKLSPESDVFMRKQFPESFIYKDSLNASYMVINEDSIVVYTLNNCKCDTLSMYTQSTLVRIDSLTRKLFTPIEPASSSSYDSTW